MWVYQLKKLLFSLRGTLPLRHENRAALAVVFPLDYHVTVTFPHPATKDDSLRAQVCPTSSARLILAALSRCVNVIFTRFAAFGFVCF
jgi:hypothetical protein